jgi:predicted secreted hydrolase
VDYKPAVPPYRFRFPRDHAAHPEYGTEWWYYTGHLNSGSRRFGYELTFFQVGIDPARRASRSAWAIHTLYFAHFTLTDENGRRFHFSENVSRPALRMAGSETGKYHVWIHDWCAALAPDGKTHRLRAAMPEGSIQLDLTPLKPPVIHGSDGVSQKSAGRGRASHYYSLTRLETRGTLTLDGQRLPVTGLSWMDHEFGSNQLGKDQAGWDWFSLQLDDQRELMLYVLRRKDGRVEPLSSGTLVQADGTWKHLPLSSYRI